MRGFLMGNTSCTPQQTAVLTDSILNMLVTDMRPLSMVEDYGFTKIIHTLNPIYTLPSRTHFTKLMERQYEETFKEVKTAINTNNSKLALTTDVWTSVATEAYLGITCHYITDDWDMQSFCLTTIPLQDRHNASNIAEWLPEIPPSKIIAIVHDYANIVVAANILEEKHGWSSVRCTGHTLQLVINTALKHPTIEKAVVAARCLVEHLKKSEFASSKLREKQQQMTTPEHSLVQDISTSTEAGNPSGLAAATYDVPTRYWDSGQPDNTRDCTMTDMNNEGKWHDVSCSNSYTFVCHEDELILIQKNLSWTEAVRYCRENHVDLVSVDSEKIQLMLTEVLHQASTAEVWLGLRHSCSVGIWFWVNGEITCYDNWAPGNETAVDDCEPEVRSGAVQSGGDHLWISLPEPH
ncbi:hypothetical protein E1301_Tti020703 [Triplophysa tibetana]|uniref:C-type lectin domain-containing protein n=1 Tax=Triplophysa tibetana TaxID=1572043 RepID=A0A5A9PHV4_9TELE|nr:hypothetical protein E1301_Tti020703 [Triplophysa tibetana]